MSPARTPMRVKPQSVPPAYTFCADEHGVCRYHPGTKSVAYAADNGTGTVHFRNVTGSYVNCDNEHFGETSVGAKKSCWIADVPTNISFSKGKPVGFYPCAKEGGKCILKNIPVADIMYGTNGKYVYAKTSSVDCNDKIFGDPAFGFAKECYYRGAQFTVPPKLPMPSKKKPIERFTTFDAPTNCYWILLILLVVALLYALYG